MSRAPLVYLICTLVLAVPNTIGRAADNAPTTPAITNLANTSWIGQEGANDTSYLKFVFQKDGTAIAYDNLGAWRGVWRMLGQRDVLIELKQPNPVNYSGQITGNHLKGSAQQLRGRAAWNWEVELTK